MRQLFLTVALICAGALTTFDYITTYDFMNSFIPKTSVGFMARAVPYAAAGFIVSVNALSSFLLTRLAQQSQEKISLKIILMLFFTSLVVDFSSSSGGFLLLFTGKTSVLEAWEIADFSTFVGAFLMGLATTMGPIMMILFWECLKEQKAFITRIVGFFGGEEPQTGMKRG